MLHGWHHRGPPAEVQSHQRRLEVEHTMGSCGAVGSSKVVAAGVGIWSLCQNQIGQHGGSHLNLKGQGKDNRAQCGGPWICHWPGEERLPDQVAVSHTGCDERTGWRAITRYGTNPQRVSKRPHRLCPETAFVRPRLLDRQRRTRPKSPRNKRRR